MLVKRARASLSGGQLVPVLLEILGFIGVIIAAVALIRGRLGWARITTRKVAGIALGGAFCVLIAGTAWASTTDNVQQDASPVAASTTTVPPITTQPPTTVATTTTTTPVPTTVPTTTTHKVAPPPTTRHTVAPTHAVHTVPAAPEVSCSASVSDRSPHHNETVDIIVHTTAGASVTVTAHYKSKDTTHPAHASGSTVDVPFDISTATYGYPVSVGVSVSDHGSSRSCSTSFTPEA